MSLKRLLIPFALAVLLAALALVPAYWHLSTPQPASLDRSENGAAIHLQIDDAQVPLENGCIHTSWSVSGARFVTLNRSPQPFIGSVRQCGAPPYLAVTFNDGTQREYSLPRAIVFTPTVRLLLVLAAAIAVVQVLWLLGWLWMRSPLGGATRSGMRWLDPGFVALWQDFRAFMQSESRTYKRLLLGIVLDGIALRLFFMFRAAGIDEAYTYVWYASQPLSKALADYSLPNNQLLNTFLMHLTTGLLGNALWTVRLPAFIAGVLVVPATYVAGRALFNRHVGLWSAALIVGPWPLVAYSTYGRGYSMVFLSFVCLLILAACLRRHRNTAAWILYAVCAALGFYAIPTMLYAFAIVAVWLFLTILVEQRGRQRWVTLAQFVLASAAAGLLTVALYLPVFLRSGVQSVTANRFIVRLPWTQFAAQLPPFLVGLGQNLVTYFPPALVALLAVGCLLGILIGQRRAAHRVPLALVTVVAVGAILVVQRVLPYDRALLFLLPLLAMLAAAGWVSLIELLRAEWRVPLRIAGALILGLWIVGTTLQNGGVSAGYNDFEPAVNFLQTQLQPGDGIKIITVDAIIEYYFRLHEYDLRYLRISNADLRRVFVIVNRGEHQTLDDVLRMNAMTEGRFAPFEMVKSFEYVDLYMAPVR